MQKKVLFIRYIDANCIVNSFDSMRQACIFVHKNFNHSKISFCKKVYSAKIKASIREGITYCGGQWIIIE